MSIHWDLHENCGNAEETERTIPALRSMRRYRCYLMDVDGNFLDAVDLERQTDEQAIREALKIKQREKSCKGFQVWEGLRMVYQQGKANLIEN